MERAEEAQNPELALAYYLAPGSRLQALPAARTGGAAGCPGEGRRLALDNKLLPSEPGAWSLELGAKSFSFTPITGADVPWMASWGLEVAIADARAVVREARRAVADKGRVILGGHSMGGMIAQCYAAWDFDGAPGHRELDGIVLLDGAVGGPTWTATTGLEQYHDGCAAIAAGCPFWDEPWRGTSPTVAILAQVAAMAASLPDWRHRPSLVAPYVDGLLPLPEPVASGVAQLTNEAFLGCMVDADTGPIPTYRAHVGRLNQCPVPGARCPARKDGSSSGERRAKSRAGCRAPDTGHWREAPPLLAWLPHHACGEPTDLARVARALRQLDGTNGLEWYASRRLNAEIDLSSNLDSRDPITADLASAAGLRLWHNASVPLPVFAANTRSAEQQLSRYTWYREAIEGSDFTLLELPEYDHLDPLFASDRPGGNRCTEALAGWLQELGSTS
jgi:pimeloyl-ACP methyl ester carboxylesterase